MSRTIPLLAAMLAVPCLAYADDNAPDGAGTAETTSPKDTALVTVLQAAIQEQMDGLLLPEAPPVYHLRYHLALLHQSAAVASWGALLNEDQSPMNLLAVEVRLGTPQFDNTGYGGWETGFGRVNLPDVLTPYALHHGTWWVTDWSYKDAVEQYARKQASFTPPPDHPGDYTLGFKIEADTRAGVPPNDDAALAVMARSLSGQFDPAVNLEQALVLVSRESGQLLTLDSEGSQVWRDLDETLVRAMAHARSTDGLLITDHRSWLVSHPTDLPSMEDMAAAVTDLTAGLQIAMEAPPLEEEYVGPVVFEDEAAVDLFKVMLVPQLEGTPPPVPFRSRYGDMGDGGDPDAGKVRLGRRVLPVGWQVTNDPQRHPTHPAAFTHDLEGTPAEPVTLVEDGIVRSLLMCRIPRTGMGASNGHARGIPGSRPAGRASMMEVHPAHHRGTRHLHRQALKLAADYGLDYVMVVRRLQDDGLRSLGGGMSMGPDGGPSLPPPVVLYRHYRDGHEEPVRGAAFAAADRWVLRDVLAAGEQVEGTWLAPFRAGNANLSTSAGMPTWLSVPEVVVGEMEIVPQPGDPRDCPLIPRPAFTATAAEQGPR